MDEPREDEILASTAPVFVPKLKPRRKKVSSIPSYYVQAVGVDKAITGFGLCKCGEWVAVPEKVYNSIHNAVLQGEKSGAVVGWKTKIEYEELEVTSNEEILSSE